MCVSFVYSSTLHIEIGDTPKDTQFFDHMNLYSHRLLLFSTCTRTCTCRSHTVRTVVYRQLDDVTDDVTDEVPRRARRALLLPHVVAQREQSQTVLQEAAQ